MRLFDTHAHYDADAFDADRMEVLSSMPGQGVELILNPGCDLKSSQTAVELAERFPFVYAAVGVHPEECADWNAEHDIPVLEALAQNLSLIHIYLPCFPEKGHSQMCYVLYKRLVIGNFMQKKSRRKTRPVGFEWSISQKSPCHGADSAGFSYSRTSSTRQSRT